MGGNAYYSIVQMKPSLKLGKFALDFTHRDRFRFFSCQEVLSKESYRTLQGAFNEVPWVKKEAGFYTQYESFVQPSDKHALASLYDPAFFFPFKSKLEKQLGISLQNKLRLAAHKLITSDLIGVHNDYTDPELGSENYRFIFQFAQKNQLISGGELSFLASRYTGEVIKKYGYSSNSGICFEITPYSFHSVTPVEGERHTLVAYLWEAGRKYDGSGTEIDEFKKSSGVGNRLFG